MTWWASFISQAACFETPAIVLLRLGCLMKEFGLCLAVAALTPAECLTCPLDRRLGGPQSQSRPADENMYCDHKFSRLNSFHHCNPYYVSINVVSHK